MVVRDLVQRGSVTDRVCARAHSLRSEERTRSSGGVGQKKRKKDAKGEGEPGEKEKREARRVDTAVRSCLFRFVLPLFELERGRWRLGKVSVNIWFFRYVFLLFLFSFVFFFRSWTILPRGNNRAKEKKTYEDCKQPNAFD